MLFEKSDKWYSLLPIYRLRAPAILLIIAASVILCLCSCSPGGDAPSASSDSSSAGAGAREWRSATYGISTSTENVKVTGSPSDEISISCDGSGKLVKYASDGLTFYYTRLDANDDNFVLSCTVKVKSWTLTNGEDDGFGLMAADSVGEDGNTDDFWNNSFAVAVTKSEFDDITMKLGITARSKTGCASSAPDDPVKAASKQDVSDHPLETSCADKGAGTYNVIGGYSTEKTGRAPEGTVDEKDLLTEIPLTIERNNTGYTISYTDPEGTVHSKTYYDEDRSALSSIDKDSIYVGLFCCRRAEISCSDLSLTVTNAKDDPPAEERKAEAIEPECSVLSADTSNSEKYDLAFLSNVDGTLSVSMDGSGSTDGSAVKAGETCIIPLTLSEGENELTLTMSRGSASGKSKPVTIKKTITFRSFSGKDIFASASGSASAKGTKDDPVDIYTAFAYAEPGQTIRLEAGTYEMDGPLTAAPGQGGSEGSPIKVTTSGDSGESAGSGGSGRAILDFGKKSKGLILAGDWWDISGIDVTNTKTGAYGIHLCGSHNVLDSVRTYENGNTGVHISRISGADGLEEETYPESRPSYNTVRNCDSYGNSDDAFEDADGFAAQFTAGTGNVFEGCTAHHNADDGWDLYAKVWIGPLDPVTIKSCIAYENGYLPDGTDGANGNGFKLGGDGMTGGHTLENCMAFLNKGCGITSNSCPDVTIRSCTSANNGGQNIRLYSRNADNTDFKVSGLISVYTDQGKDHSSDQVEVLGSQDESAVFGDTAYYYGLFGDGEKASSNKSGTVIDPAKVFKSTKFTEDQTIRRADDGSLSVTGGYLRTVSDQLRDSGARL